MTDRLLTAEEVAEMIGMTPDYVYALSRRSAIPTITFGRTRRYRREAVVAWLEQMERGTVGGPSNKRAGAAANGPAPASEV